MTSINERKGYVYVIYNTVFDKYGECYKIGQTKNIDNRIKDYATYYPEDCELKYVKELDNYKYVEKQVHRVLKEYRISSNREFFKCSLDTIIDCIEKVSSTVIEEIKDEEKEYLENINNDTIFSYLMKEDTSWIEKGSDTDCVGVILAEWLMEKFTISIVGKNMFSLKYKENNIIITRNELFKRIYTYDVKKKIGFCIFDKNAKEEVNLLGYRVKLLDKTNTIKDDFINTIINNI